MFNFLFFQIFVISWSTQFLVEWNFWLGIVSEILYSNIKRVLVEMYFFE